MAGVLPCDLERRLQVLEQVGDEMQVSYGQLLYKCRHLSSTLCNMK